ncbi:MAG: hypothetical protein GX897_06500 [Clostridiales bacterium]|nr:hypothetical protein [Clostridiales bacterium]
MLSSLLFLSREDKNEQYLTEDTLLDLKLDRLFTKRALSILRRPCKPELIRAREELFALLDGEILETLTGYADRLNDSRKRLCSVSNEPVRFAAFVVMCGRYIELVEYSASLEPRGTLFGRFVESAANILRDERFIRMKSSLTEARADIDELKACAISAPPGKWLMHKPSGDENAAPKPDDGSEVIRCVKSLTGASLRYPAHVAHYAPAGVITGIKKLCPDELKRLDEFCRESSWIAGDGALLLNELRFIKEIRDFCEMLKSRGLPCCAPKIAETRKIHAADAIDGALTLKTADIVPNDLDFDEKEHLFFLTGANGGGKTTYLRSVGIITILFLAGCPVPAKSAEIWPFKNVVTHFPYDERFEDGGRLADEIHRIDNIMETADGDTIVLLNETFSGTDERKSERLIRETAEELNRRGVFGVWVTHVHSFGEDLLPALSVEVDENDSNRRTFKVIRKKVFSGSYARDILEKYGLTAEQLKIRDTKAI